MEETIEKWNGMDATEIAKMTTAKIIDRTYKIVELELVFNGKSYNIIPRESNVNDDGWYYVDAGISGMSGRYAIQIGDNYNGGIHMIRCDRKIVDDINAKVSELLKTMD